MLLRLSRLSLCLALAAAALAFIGPGAWRGPAGDVALALGAAAFLLWRAALALRARHERAAQAVPEAVPLDAAALAEAVGLVVTEAMAAVDFEAALHAVADRLRAELGARSARIFAISERDGVAGLRELVPAEPGFRATRREIAPGTSPLARALHERRPCIALPEAVVLPVLRDGRLLAVLELTDVALAVEVNALSGLLGAAAGGLADRADALAPERNLPTTRLSAAWPAVVLPQLAFEPGGSRC